MNATKRKSRTLEHVTSGEMARIEIGEYKGTLTAPLSRQYSPWSGNVAMYRGLLKDGTEVTVYANSDDHRIPSRWNRD